MKTLTNIEIWFIRMYGKLLFTVGTWWIFSVCEWWDKLIEKFK